MEFARTPQGKAALGGAGLLILVLFIRRRRRSHG
jgi:MYXO-CTERM domain-containing protein